jgi:hypothetical protein
MNVLFVGDVVGPEASAWRAEPIPGLRQEHEIDLAIVNAENCRVGGPPPDALSGISWNDNEGLFAAWPRDPRSWAPSCCGSSRARRWRFAGFTSSGCCSRE